MGLTNFQKLTLAEQLEFTLDHVKTNERVKAVFKKQLAEGNLSIAENPKTHLIVYFVVYNPETASFLLTSNNATNLWLIPGGHLEKGENLTDAVKREVREELGLDIKDIDPPFLLTLTTPTSNKRNCQQHLDVWFLIKDQPDQGLQIDSSEMRRHIWFPAGLNQIQITDPATKQALKLL